MLELVSHEDGSPHHVTVIRAIDYSPDTFEALDADAQELDQDSLLSEKTCCHWNRCSQPRNPGASTVSQLKYSTYTMKQKPKCARKAQRKSAVRMRARAW